MGKEQVTAAEVKKLVEEIWELGSQIILWRENIVDVREKLIAQKQNPNRKRRKS